MKYVDEFYNEKMCKTLAKEIDDKSRGREVVLMEVCGTHTMSIFRNGIRNLLPENVKIISGPGCPVCVTPNPIIDRAIALSRLENICITTFGDMMRVPGSSSSLLEERGKGADIKVVYSPKDALTISEHNQNKKVVFLGIGFETTAPTVASILLDASSRCLKNFFILPANKLIPPAIKALLDSGETNIDGFLLPGHVSVIIGTEPYKFIANDYRIPCVIAGFEPVDIMYAIQQLVEMIITDGAEIVNCYTRSVKREGNRIAKEMMKDVFFLCDSEWRGLGFIPDSGLEINDKYRDFDVLYNIDVEVEESKEHPGCLCGEVLRGVSLPSDCSLFGDVCTPESPAGPCMVSSEGTCAAYYKYADYRR